MPLILLPPPTMPLKQKLLERVPKTFQREPSFRALLSYLQQHDIRNEDHLLAFLQQDIALVKKSLEKFQRTGSTGVKTARDLTMKLETLKKYLAIAKRYL